ncbi:UvrB/UvrC motif-containing protein [Ornithinibacillus halophilus]|uniref:Protein arginine kinase activator n=1 Tax=Ornithinibacillus halophilus TaxID=930117 RepID=A0A1M5HAJ7_9BACI|nr:UvrB/UvrC motif-containing protein [Ornithinibacillus halophilus]SHG12999.1 protein arginine kinase activator [Ornithinibacillus halophilus]
MECQECHKRPATLHFTQVINGNKTEIQLCEVCAKEKGYMTYPEDGYSLHNLLSGLFNFDSNHIGTQKKDSQFQQVKELQCARCEMTFSEFKRVGKFGCAECYHTFSSHLDPIFRRVHSGNTKHRGKIPKRKGGDLHIKKQIESYKSELQELIVNEEFEKAATVRDKIRELEMDIRNKQDGDQS